MCSRLSKARSSRHAAQPHSYQLNRIVPIGGDIASGLRHGTASGRRARRVDSVPRHFEVVLSFATLVFLRCQRGPRAAGRRCVGRVLADRSLSLRVIVTCACIDDLKSCLDVQRALRREYTLQTACETVWSQHAPRHKIMTKHTKAGCPMTRALSNNARKRAATGYEQNKSARHAWHAARRASGHARRRSDAERWCPCGQPTHRHRRDCTASSATATETRPGVEDAAAELELGSQRGRERRRERRERRGRKVRPFYAVWSARGRRAAPTAARAAAVECIPTKSPAAVPMATSAEA